MGQLWGPQEPPAWTPEPLAFVGHVSPRAERAHWGPVCPWMLSSLLVIINGAHPPCFPGFQQRCAEQGRSRRCPTMIKPVQRIPRYELLGEGGHGAGWAGGHGLGGQEGMGLGGQGGHGAGWPGGQSLRYVRMQGGSVVPPSGAAGSG